MRGEAPVVGQAGQAFFMTRGTPHGFKNVGQTTAAVFEIFVKQSKGAAAWQLPAGLAFDANAIACAAQDGSCVSAVTPSRQ